MGQQKVRKARCTNTHLKKLTTPNSEPAQSLPGPYNSYPKVARNQPKPRTDVIVRYLQNYPAMQTQSKNFERPKAARNQISLKAKKRTQSVSVGSSILARSLPTYSEFEFKSYTKTKPAAIKGIKFGSHPKPKELATIKIPKDNSHKDLQSLPKKHHHRKDEQKIDTSAKKTPIVKPALLQSASTQSKINRSIELKRREFINKSKTIPPKLKSPDIYQAKPKILVPKPSIDSRNKQKKLRKVPDSKFYDQQKITGLDYPVHIGFREQWSLDPTEICHSLPKLPGELRSILKRSMNYSQIKKLDEDSLQHITEGKGPVDECLCNLLSTPESKGRGIKGSIRRAFASLSSGKKRGGGGQNSADIPLTFTQGGKGGIYSKKEVLKRKSPCGKCGCDKGPVVLKHSYANIRITSPDLSTLCSCPDDCFPDKDKYNGKIKVTVERMALDSDDSELSLHKRTQQLAIPEPTMIAAMNDRSIGDLSDRSEWSSGD